MNGGQSGQVAMISGCTCTCIIFTLLGWARAWAQWAGGPFVIVATEVALAVQPILAVVSHDCQQILEQNNAT